MMRIRRFEAPDTTTALAMVRKEMGEDAVILTTRSISGGKNGKKPWFEVVAAMDSAIEALVNQAPAAAPRVREEPGPPATARSQNQPLARPAPPLPGPARTAYRPAGEPAVNAQPLPAALPGEIRSEARELRQRFGRMLARRPDPGPTPARPPAGRPDPADVARWREQIVGRIKISDLTLDPGRLGPLILALIGSTGVGKTTTAAKLAAWFSLREQARVALISTDCYRIGATDQLRTYARIMRLPCELALRKKDLAQIIARQADKDVIIIDTTGRSPYDHGHLAELAEWFAAAGPLSPLLLLPATAKKEDLATIVAAHAPLAPAGLVLTKVDETRAYAALCQQVAAGDTPVTWVCTGQRVPEDFLPASRNLLEKLFMEGWDAAVSDMTPCLREYRT